jgi:hypothetical protein
LWVWNTPRQGYPGHPKNPRYKGLETTKTGVVATFQNSGSDPALVNAELFYEEQFWEKLGITDGTVSVNTFRGHVWRVVVDGVEVRRWTIDVDDGSQAFVI